MEVILRSTSINLDVLHLQLVRQESLQLLVQSQELIHAKLLRFVYLLNHLHDLIFFTLDVEFRLLLFFGLFLFL